MSKGQIIIPRAVDTVYFDKETKTLVNHVGWNEWRFRDSAGHIGFVNKPFNAVMLFDKLVTTSTGRPRIMLKSYNTGFLYNTTLDIYNELMKGQFFLLDDKLAFNHTWIVKSNGGYLYLDFLSELLGVEFRIGTEI